MKKNRGHRGLHFHEAPSAMSRWEADEAQSDPTTTSPTFFPLPFVRTDMVMSCL